jgi:hypothetical protein
MRRALLLLSLIFCAEAFAQGQRLREEDPIPYPEDEEEEDRVERKLPRRSGERIPTRPYEAEPERREREVSLAGLDDPNYGLSAELIGGAMLLEASKGGGVEPRFCWGLRLNWEWGRQLSDEFLREQLWADVTWSYAALRDGTASVYADTNYHYVTASQAYAFPFGGIFSAYGQAGAGLAFQLSTLHVGADASSVAGTKPLFLLGAGLRARTNLTADERIKLTVRLEITRLVRQYMHDTLLALSAGAVF